MAGVRFRRAPLARATAAARQRLAKALRANLGRRKAQKIDRAKQTGDAAKSKTAQGEDAQTGPAQNKTNSDFF